MKNVGGKEKSGKIKKLVRNRRVSSVVVWGGGSRGLRFAPATCQQKLLEKARKKKKKGENSR